MTRSALAAAARLCVDSAGGPQRIRWSQAWPLLIRPTGADQVHLVHGAGGPLGGDVFSLDLAVAPAATLRVRGAGATIVQPGAGEGEGARWDVAADVGSGGRLDWAPEATVVCDGAALESVLRVDLAVGAAATVREVVVLGRYDERGGRYRGTLDVRVDGVPLLAHTTLLDGADAALSGPAGTAGSRAIGTLLVAGARSDRSEQHRPDQGRPEPDGAGEATGVRWAWSALDGPGLLLLAVGDPGPVAAVLTIQRPAAQS